MFTNNGLLVVVFVVIFSFGLSQLCAIHNADGTVRKHKVVIFADAKFINVFVNWFLFFHNTCGNVDNLDIICLDSRTSEQISKLGLKCSEKSFRLRYSFTAKNKLGKIWLSRVETITDYLTSGYDVVLSDSDALFMTNEMFTDFSGYGKTSELVSSRAWWPWPQFRKWGATLCMGFTYWKVGRFSIELFTSIRHELQLQADINSGSPDDQIAVNNILDQWNISWADRNLTGKQTILSQITPSPRLPSA